MKKTILLLILSVSVLFGGCTVPLILPETTGAENDTDTTAIVIEIVTTDVFATEEETVSLNQEIVTDEQTTASEETTTAKPAEQTTVSEEKTTKEEITAKEEKTTVAQPSSEVELNISMPEKNGTMKTDFSPDNKYIKIVNKEKKIDAALLLAVFSVPESGQNYVFEFYDADDFSADNIRRVYLIDPYGDITSVAATESSERENISPVENWFCMNVLIKEIIYPAVSDRD